MNLFITNYLENFHQFCMTFTKAINNQCYSSSENVPTTSGSSSSTPHTPIISGRSRSNSWRGSNNRRACTILKEESEEELSSYLRSSSRQSSRLSFLTAVLVIIIYSVFRC